MPEDAWKIVDLLERLAKEDHYDLIRDELTRLAGRLEAKGLQKVRVAIERISPGNMISVRMDGRCPCGAKLMSCVEHWPVNMFEAGPHTLKIRLRIIEDEMLNHLGQPAL